MDRIIILGFVILLVGFVDGKPSNFKRPVIYNASNGEEININAKETLTLICEGRENITWTYPNNTLDETYWSTVQVETSEANGKYFSKLTLHNASFVDVDYYYCHAENAAKDDPQRSSKIYVYVRDEEHLSVRPADEIEFLTAVQHTTIILPCRPTAPDIIVNLVDINGDEVNNSSYDKHLGFTTNISIFDGHFYCKFSRDGVEEDLSIIVTVITGTEYVTKPYIEAPSNGRTKVGTKYVLNCTVTVQTNVYFTLTWTTPNKPAEMTGRITSTVATASDINGLKHGSSSLTIEDVQHQDAGEYTCIITDHTFKTNSVSKNITVFGENGSYINLKEETGMITLNVTSGTPYVQWVVVVDSFPKADIIWYKNKDDEITKNTKYEINFDNTSSVNKALLKIKQITLNDSGIYKIEVNNGKDLKNLNFTLIVNESPTVHQARSQPHL